MPSPPRKPADPLLDALEALALPAPAAGSAGAQERGPDRYAWRLSPRGGSLQVDVLACRETPRGWREGERIPLRDLPGTGDLPGASEARALEALRVWSRRPEGLPFALLAALEGHPRLSWAPASGGAGDRVALARELAVLVVRGTPQGWRLALSLRPEEAPVRLRREGDRLLFTASGPVHRALDRLLGEGRTVQEGHAPRLAALLAKLQPHIPLLTDLAPAPAPQEAPPDRSLRLWLKGGGERLDLRGFIQSAPGLPWQVPGEGPALAVAGPPRARRFWRRDLAFELRRAAQVEALLPPSARPLGEPFAWRLEGREAVATFLAGLRDLGSRIRLEGIPGFVPDLPRMPRIAVGVRETPAGLELRGTLGDHPIERLLPQLRLASRFLWLESGAVLDLASLEGLRRAAAWGEAGPGCVRLPAGARPALAGLEAEPDPEVPQEPPPGFQGRLRPYQLEGFRWMARLLGAGLGACLADDMGLGKTVQTAALLVHRADQGPALVVAPTSVGPNWRTELGRFAPGLRVRLLQEGNRVETLGLARPGDVIVASYGLLSEKGLQDVAWGTVVLDEAHAIKNPETRRAQACRLLQARGRLALTGTPVENHPGELASLLGWLLPDLEARFLGAPDAETLRLLAAPFLLRRRKADVLKELPPRTDLTVRVELDEAEAAFHRELLERCRSEALAGSTLNVLAALMKLRRACAHPALVEPAYAGPGAKVDLLLDRLATLREEGHRSLVFSQFTDLLDLVQKRLTEAGVSWVRLDGSMPAKARQRAVEAFQKGEAGVFLLSLRAGGTGLNLTAADDVFHLDPWWNPAVEDQASDRAHRMGRTRPVTVHRLVATGTVEERVLALHEAKRAMVEQLLEGREEAAPLDRETLLGLLG